MPATSSVSFVCPSCRQPFTVSAAASGKKTACPGCGRRLQIPTPSQAAVTTLHVPQPQPRSRRPLILLLAGGAGLFTSLLAVALLAAGCFTKADQKGQQQAHPDGKQPDGGPDGGLPLPVKPEKRGEPDAEAEELVKTWVRRNVNRPELKITKFGPHGRADEVRKLFVDAGIEGQWQKAAAKFTGTDYDFLVRIVFRIEGKGGKNPALANLNGIDVGGGLAEHDLIVPVKGKAVPADLYVAGDSIVTEGVKRNRHGDDWKAQLRKEIARDHPAIKDE